MASGTQNAAAASLPHQQQRARRLSNSSMASDVSFRLPAYDSPAIYHLETDVDVSASETESVAGTAGGSPNQLDLVSKDKLFQAYKKALDRYQKYRERYTELARRYRELEKDNTKARAVLVETQDKALRRMSELREQCVLEQQAKAHLDSALRMEIDELQCVVKTLRSKLEMVGENGNGTGDQDLISLIGQEDGTNGNAVVRDTSALEERIKALESKLNEELRQKAVLSLEVSELKKREEEHTITIAENKMAIHSELEAKEAEVRKLKEQLASLEKNMKQTLTEKDGLGKELSEVRKVANKVKELEGTLSLCNEQKNKLESKFIDFERTIMELEKDKQQLKATNLTLDYEKGELQKKISESEGKLATLTEERDTLSTQLKDLEQKTAQSLSNTSELESLKQQLEEAKQRAETSSETMATIERKITEKEQQFAVVQSERDELERKVQQTQALLREREQEIERLEQQQSQSTQKAQQGQEETSKKLQQAEDELAACRKTQSLDQEKLTELTKALDAAKELHDRDRKSNEASLKDVFERNNELSEQLEQFKEKLEKLNAKFKKLTEEKNSLRAANEELSAELKQSRQELKQLTSQKQALTDEVRNLKIINENSESEALRSLQESMRASMATAEEKLLETTRDLNHVLELKSEENRRLSEERDELSEKLENSHREKTDLEAEGVNLRAKIETIRGEKKDLEKTLEREIREKTELKTQVTNILQEIGRLEDQLKEVREAHSTILDEKQTLEEKIERLQREHCESRLKLEKDTIGKLQAKLKEHESKLQEVECENSQLAEKNCLLEESSRRTVEEQKKLNLALKEAEDRLRTQRQRCDELETQVKTVTDQLSQCTGDHAKLFNEKELLDHQHRSLQDALETKEKEKLCVLDTNKCLEEELAKLRSENDYLKGKHNELKVLLENDKRRLMDQNDALQKQMEELAREKQSLGRNATDLEKRLASYEEVKIENEYLNTLTKQLQAEVQEVKGKLAAKESELATGRTKQSQTETMLEERDKEITKLINEFVAKEQKQEREHKERIEELEKSNRTQLDALTERLKEEGERKLKEQQSHENTRATELEAKLAEATSKRDTLEATLRSLQEQIDGNAAELERLRTEQNALQELRLENANYARDLDELKSELNVAIAEKLRLTEEKTTEEQQLRVDRERLTAENDELRTKLEQFKVETEQTVSRFEAEIEELKREQPTEPTVVAKVETSLQQGPAVAGYDELRNKKEELENKLKKIMHEVQDVSNRNLFLEQKCENYLILEQSNERLKLANDKLTRQLDETLVSIPYLTSYVIRTANYSIKVF